MKQSIIDRATNYANMVAGGSPDILMAGEAYQQGAEDEHRLLTEWHNALKELPDLNKPVLVRDEFDEYHIGKLTEKGWNVETWLFVDQGIVFEWREIWEM